MTFSLLGAFGPRLRSAAGATCCCAADRCRSAGEEASRHCPPARSFAMRRCLIGSLSVACDPALLRADFARTPWGNKDRLSFDVMASRCADKALRVASVCRHYFVNIRICRRPLPALAPPPFD